MTAAVNVASLGTAMVANSSGNVGIGTSSPGYALDVRSASPPMIRMSRSGTAGQIVSLLFEDGNATLGAGSTTRIASDAGAMSFSTGGTSGSDSGGTERARFAANGLYEHKTNVNFYRISLVENTNNTSGNGTIQSNLGSNCNNTSSYHFIANTNSIDKAYILGNGNLQNVNNSYGALSDVKLKENIVDATPKLADLMQVKVRNYNLIGDTTKQIGVVAQELETVFPALVDESLDRNQEGDNLGATTKSVKYSVFVPMLIKAIQEQQALITQLQADVATLKTIMEQLA